MKTNQRIFILLGVLIIGAITLYVGSNLSKKNKSSSELSNFVISIKTNGNQIIMTCEKGCAWKELSYTVTSDLNEETVIDEYGVQLRKDVSEKRDASLANFLFKIQKVKKGLKLKGIEGTAWVELGFTLAENRFQKIDNLGMFN